MKTEIKKIEYQCFVCGEVTKRKPTEPRPSKCPHCKEVDGWTTDDSAD